MSEPEVRDVPGVEFQTTMLVEVYRVCRPDCRIKIEKVLQLPSKARRSASALRYRRGEPVSVFSYKAKTATCEAEMRRLMKSFGFLSKTL